MSIIVHDCPFCGSGFIALTKSVKDIGECWAYCEDCESTGPSAHTEAGALGQRLMISVLRCELAVVPKK